MAMAESLDGLWDTGNLQSDYQQELWHWPTVGLAWHATTIANNEIQHSTSSGFTVQGKHESI